MRVDTFLRLVLRHTSALGIRAKEDLFVVGGEGGGWAVGNKGGGGAGVGRGGGNLQHFAHLGV